MRLINFILLFCFSLVLAGQKRELTSLQVEQTSKALLHKMQYDSLLIWHKNAIENGIDYYYLHQRSAIAYNQLNKFNRSILEIKRLKKYNSAPDPSLNPLMINNLVGIGNFRKAKLVYRKQVLVDSLKQAPQAVSLNFLYTESFLKTPKSNQALKNTSHNQLFGSFRLFELVDFSLAVTKVQTTIYTEKIEQWQYYTKLNIPLLNSLEGELYYHHLSYSSQFNSTQNDLVTGATLYKLFHKKKLYISGNYLSFQNKEGAQVLLGLKGSLPSSTNFSYTLEPIINWRAQNSFASLNGGLSWYNSRFGAAINYHYVGGSNTIESNGYIVNNNSDKTYGRYTASLHYSLKNLLFLLYLQKESKYDVIGESNYTHNNIGIGLKYSPNHSKSTKIKKQ